MDFPLHSLQDYCALLEQQGLLSAPLPSGLDLTRTVQLISYDSHSVVPGTLFICKGAHFKAAYLADAAVKGAFAYVSEVPYPDVDLPCILVKDMRRTLAPLAILYYNDPSSRLKVIGITGTKGKSSTAYYLKYILDEYLAAQGKRCGIISSIDTYDGVEEFESHLTTPEPLELQKHFANACSSGMEYLVMEASSQALKYHRTLGTHFAAACFLNIGRDHISPIEHPTFEDYFLSKLKIFSQAEMSVVNLDSDHADEILAAAKRDCAKVITYSCKDPEADVYGKQIEKQTTGFSFQVAMHQTIQPFQINMPGLFNVENALAAIAVSDGLGVPQQAVYMGLTKASVPGRMEVFSNTNGDVTAIVDYAHNRMSFETLFRSVLQEYPGRRIVTVFGCPGKKALERRRDLGEISGQYSDFVVLTEEDSGEEDTVSICKEISSYVAAAGCEYKIEPNRGEAIRTAILNSHEPSVILITGKGRETRQKRGLAYIDTPSDVEYVATWLQEYDVIHGLDGSAKAGRFPSVLPLLTKLSGRTLVVCADSLNNETLHSIAVLKIVGVQMALFVRGYEPGPDPVPALKSKKRNTTSAYGSTWYGELDKALKDIGVQAKVIPFESIFTAQADNASPGTTDVLSLATTASDLIQGYWKEKTLPVFCVTENNKESQATTPEELACKTAEQLDAWRMAFLLRKPDLSVDGRDCVRLHGSRALELLQAGRFQEPLSSLVSDAVHAVQNGVQQVAFLGIETEQGLLRGLLDEPVPETVIMRENS